VALSIAGSDSSSGAGIQADLKSFSALGVYGCTVITAVTAQNTRTIAAIEEISSDLIRNQIQSILTDIPPNAIKIGMVYNKKVIKTICDSLQNVRAPIVLDPVMSSGSGVKLLVDNDLQNYISNLIPLSTIITPNLTEAQKITGIKIRSEQDIRECIKVLKAYGAASVVIKGANFQKNKIIDFLWDNDKKSLIKIRNRRIKYALQIHGAGCNFSAAVTAFLAQNLKIVDACKLANKYVHSSIRTALKLGNGLIVNDPISSMYDSSLRYNVLRKLNDAISRVCSLDGLGVLIPETQSNLVFALPYARRLDEVAGVKGRVIKIERQVKPASIIDFNASKHVGSAVLAYMSVNSEMRSAMNIKFDDRIISICKSHFEVSSYERSEEPIDIKRKEGSSIFWGIKNALSRNDRADIIYHLGDFGKEPMVMVFALDPITVFHKVKKILKLYDK
jgi:hydroxymethylpyrimidine kinase/phosphomethylpyrimidine kinase